MKISSLYYGVFERQKKVVFWQISDKKKLFSTTFWEVFGIFFTLRTCFWNINQKLTRLRVLKVLRLWLEDVLISLLTWRFQLVFSKKVFFCETKVVSKLNLVSFCETKVVSQIFQSFWWYFFFCRKFQGLKIAVFCLKFTICWVSQIAFFLW